jgi:cell division protein FtsI (penicillin-binding protein 3)
MNFFKKKNNNTQKNKKSFYYDDYSHANNIKTKNNNPIEISKNRMAFIFFVILSIAVILSIKILYLSFFEKESFSNIYNKKNFLPNRIDIVDRNGEILARSVNAWAAGISPKLIKDEKKLLINLKIIFPNLNLKKLEEKIAKGKFFYISRRLNNLERDKLWLLAKKAVIIERKQIRIYPHNYLFSHVIGQIDEDNFGISGIEKSYDLKLKEKNDKNKNLKLSLDSNLQFLIRNELFNGINTFSARGSAALLMDVTNGEVLSLVSLPDFNLMERKDISDTELMNKITLSVYELGSVFKTFTIAAALEKGIVNPDTEFQNLEKKIKCRDKWISEHDELPKNLNVEQILVRSSNIGAIKIVRKIGSENYSNFLQSLGLLGKINFDIPEVGTPLPFEWENCALETASYGHGIATTPLQLARAYAIIGNGGYAIEPTLIKNNNFQFQNRIISQTTSEKINKMLSKVVKQKEGTANLANISGYDVGGKTGTSKKINNGEYTQKKLNTFVSLFPIKNPKYLLLVLMDEPKPAPNLVYSYNGTKISNIRRNDSGWNSAYIAGRIIEKIGPILATNNLNSF